MLAHALRLARHVARLTLHNFASRKKRVCIDVGRPDGKVLVDVFGDRHSLGRAAEAHELDLEGYGYRWFRVARLITR